MKTNKERIFFTVLLYCLYVTMMDYVGPDFMLVGIVSLISLVMLIGAMYFIDLRETLVEKMNKEKETEE